MGHLGGTAVERLPSVQGVIPALWDRVPASGSLLSGEPASSSPSALTPLVLFLSQKNL